MLKLLIASLVMLAPVVSAADSSETWNQLRSLYDSGKPDDAVLLLQKNPSDDAAYYYNLGTLYLRTQRPGLAVSYLEKSYRLRPLDADVRHNLDFARNALARTMGSDRLDPGSNWLDLIGDELSLGPARAALGMVAFSLLLFSLGSYRKNRSLREWMKNGVGPLGSAGLAALLLFATAPKLSGARQPAFAIERQALRSGPGEQFFELSQIEAGTKLRLLDSASPAPSPGSIPQGDGLWYQVRFSNDGIGWVKASRLLIL